MWLLWLTGLLTYLSWGDRRNCRAEGPLHHLFVKHLQLFRDDEHGFIFGELKLAESFLG